MCYKNNEAYQSSKHSASLIIVNDKRKGSVEVLEDLIGRVRPAVTKSAVCLDHQHGLVGELGTEPVLRSERAQVTQAAHKHAIHFIQATEQPIKHSIQNHNS